MLQQILPFPIPEQDLWESLQVCGKPIVLYGMGDGALKIMRACAAYDIPIADVFASDGYVRGHSFAGYRVKRLCEIEAQWGDFVILIAFAVFRPELIDMLTRLSLRHETYAPDVPVCGEELFDRSYALAHADELSRAYALMADDQSRLVFAHTVQFKLSGRLPLLDEMTTLKDEAYQNILRLSPQEHYVDLGAYDGDTIAEFLTHTGGRYSSICALEPDGKNFRKLSAYAASLPQDGRVQLYNAAAWDRCTTLSFDGRAGRNSSLQPDGKHHVAAYAVDALLQGNAATYLKMDVEGAEYEALCGCKQTIAQHRPSLAVSCYHRSQDLFRLPLLIASLYPGCRIYLRHHPYIPAWETNLYVMPDETDRRLSKT